MTQYDCTLDLVYDIDNNFTKVKVPSTVGSLKGTSLIFAEQFRSVNLTGCPITDVKFEVLDVTPTSSKVVEFMHTNRTLRYTGEFGKVNGYFVMTTSQGQTKKSEKVTVEVIDKC